MPNNVTMDGVDMAPILFEGGKVGVHFQRVCSCRGVGASTATPALAVVDFGPTYLVGLLRATYSRATSLCA